RFAASQGIGCVHEVNAPHIAPFDDLALIAELTSSEPLPTVVGYWGELFGGDADAEAVSGYAGDLNVDGSIGSHTAYLRDAYADAPTRGYGYLNAEQIGKHVAYCTERTLQAGFHVIGDAALDAVVDGLRRASAEVGREELIRCRHRLEHVEMPSAEVTDTIAELGVVASVQPAFDAAWGAAGQLYEQRLGTRAQRMNPFASFHDAGVVLAFGSDSPVTPMNPWAGVRAAVFHSNRDERLDVRTAFDAATVGGHRAGRRDDAGVLTPGSPATYAVWEAPTPLDRGLPNLTSDGPLPSCVSTVVDGAPIFSTSEGQR
ncbi:MAG: amidohydrolase family protein, partial [Propionibacteriales bacterium]|nr:amidohydrolase family protein [Propionibacteriales bacterium]